MKKTAATKGSKKSAAAVGEVASANIVTDKKAAKKGKGVPVSTGTTPAGGASGAGSPASNTTTGGQSGAVLSSSLALMTPAQIALCTSLVQQIVATLPSQQPLTAVQKRRAAKMRSGGTEIGATVLSLASTYNVQPATLPMAAVQSQLATAAALSDLSQAMTAAQKAFDDYQFSLQSSNWATITTLYTVLKRLAKTNGALETGLAPVVAFFTHRSASVKAAHPKTAKGKAALAQAKSAAGATSMQTPPIPSPTPATASSGATTGHA